MTPATIHTPARNDNTGDYMSQSSQSHGSSLSKVAGTTATTLAAQHLPNHVCLAICGTADLPIELEYQLTSDTLRIP